MNLQNSIATMWIIVLLATEVLLAISGDDFSDSTDGDQSRKILGSSVVTSVSVIMDNGNGSKTVYTDAVGRPIGKPPTYSDLASPINLLNPDRYEFYTFDDNGNLVRRLMSLEEIKTIIATGDSDGLELDSMISESYIPEKKVKDVLTNVQDVLKEEMELHKNKLSSNPIFDTPDVSDTWSMILPAVFGNSGADITPEKPIVHVTPDTITLDTQDIVHTTMKPIVSTLKFDENLTTQSFSTDSSKLTKGEMEVTTSYVMRQSPSGIMNGNTVPPTISTDVNIPTLPSSTPYKQSSMQITDHAEVTENRDQSSSLATSSKIHVVPTTESMRKTETTDSDLQTSPLTESYTELPEITQFSTWTADLSTIPGNKEVPPMSLSTWRPDFSNSDQESVSSTSTTRMAASSSSRTQLPSSEDPKTITPGEIFMSTTPFMKFDSEANKLPTTEQYSQEMFTTLLQLSQAELASNQSSTSETPIQILHSTKTFETRTEVVEQTSEKSETVTEILTTINMPNAVNESSTTDTTFMGSLQELLSQTLHDVGGLVSNMNDTPPMQNIGNMTKLPSRPKLEYDNTNLSMNNSLDGGEHSQIASTTSMPAALNTMVSGSTESTAEADLDITTYFEKNNIVKDNQTGEAFEITTSKVETHTRPILLNITILNSEGNRSNISALQHVHGSNVPSKNTKTEKGSETTTEVETDTIETVTTGTVNATRNNATKDNTMMDNATMDNATKDNATMDNATRNNATLSNATVDNATMDNATKDNATTDNATKNNAIMKNSTRNNATLSNATMDNATMDNATKDNATMDNATKDNAIMNNSTRNNATLSNATMDNATMDNASMDNSPLEEITSKLPLTSEITQVPSKSQTESTPSTNMVSPSVNSEAAELELTPSSYASTETTKNPSIEILISENKTNYTSEKPETHDDATDENIIKVSDPQQNFTISNKFGENLNSSKGNTTIAELNEHKNVTFPGISSNGSYPVTERQSIHTNTTESNLVESEGNIQKDNISTEQSTNGISSSPENSTQTTVANTHSKNTTSNILEHTTHIVHTENETDKNISSQNHPAQESSYQPAKEGSYIEDSKKKMSNETDDSEGDGDWTLVSTITPHPSVSSSQKVQTPQQNYPELIAPPTPVDLKAKPMQGFGLEDSTTSLDIEVYQFTQLCNELAFGFWKTVTSDVSSARSIFVSPFGAISLLAMIFLGARGSTSGEMNEILKLDDMVTFNPHLIFKNVSESIKPEETDSGVVSSAIIRELFSDRLRGKLLPFYKERARAFYDGFVEEVNFSEIGDVIRRRTNLQVKKSTKGKIKEFLKDASIIARSPLAGISVNIFQTDCAKVSTEGRDGELHFVVLPSIRQRRLVPIPAVVYKSGFLAGYEPSLDATAVSIGSKDQITSTIFVISGQQGMPVPGDGLARLEKSLVESSFRKGAWSRLLRSLIPREGLEVQIPRIAHRSVINATSALKKMGMSGLFDKQKADLSGMNGIPNELFLTDLLQVNSFSTCGDAGAGDKHHAEIYPAVATRERRFLTLDDDEDTFLEGEQTLDSSNRQSDFIDPLYTPRFLDLPLPARPRQARVPDTPRLRFDRPFLYFVRHNPTGLILHIGRFNPRLLP